MANRLFILLIWLSFSTQSFALDSIRNEDKNYFDTPLKIPLLLSGNFGELRSNHFHSGLDFKTQGREGLPVYAPADGFVSRIKVSPYGYGLALYIDHPNGYTTVFGHLSRYNKVIDAYVKERQYRKQRFDVDLQLSPETIRIKRGEVIAYSGNTGGSGGPHLHFEIRETASARPVNPLLFNFPVKDNTPPVIKGLMLYPLSANASINGKHEQQAVAIEGGNGKYTLASGSKITANGTIGLALFVQDFLDGSANRCGIFENTLLVNQEPIYSFKMDRFDFSDSKYANSYVDYAYWKKTRTRYQKSFVEEGNAMTNFGILKNRGAFQVDGNDTSRIKYLVSDVHGNLSTLHFNIDGEMEKTKPQTPAVGKSASPQAPLLIETAHASANFHSHTFCSPVEIACSEEKANSASYSPIVLLGSEYIPTLRSYQLKIKANQLPLPWKDKAAIALLDEQNKAKKLFASQHSGDWVAANVGELGRFAVVIDSVKPSIKAPSIDKHQSLNNSKQINFRVSDDLSGIKSWRGEIDGEWVLFEYEYKKNRLFYVFDESRMKFNSTHTLKLEVSDELGNTASYEATFYK